MKTNLVKEIERLQRENRFTQGHATQIEDRTNRALSESKEYENLSNKNNLVAGRSGAFGALYEAILAYQEGHLISGATLFATLAKTKVFAPNSTLEENIANYDSLLGDIKCGDKKNLEKFEEGFKMIREMVIPFLTDYHAQIDLRSQTQLEVMQDILASGQVRKMRK